MHESTLWDEPKLYFTSGQEGSLVSDGLNCLFNWMIKSLTFHGVAGHGKNESVVFLDMLHLQIQRIEKQNQIFAGIVWQLDILEVVAKYSNSLEIWGGLLNFDR